MLLIKTISHSLHMNLNLMTQTSWFSVFFFFFNDKYQVFKAFVNHVFTNTDSTFAPEEQNLSSSVETLKRGRAQLQVFCVGEQDAEAAAEL